MLKYYNLKRVKKEYRITSTPQILAVAEAKFVAMQKPYIIYKFTFIEVLLFILYITQYHKSQFSLNRLYNLYNIHPLDRHRLLTFTTLYISTLIRSYSHMKANSLNFALLLLTYLIWYVKLLW